MGHFDPYSMLSVNKKNFELFCRITSTIFSKQSLNDDYQTLKKLKITDENEPRGNSDPERVFIYRNCIF